MDDEHSRNFEQCQISFSKLWISLGLLSSLALPGSTQNLDPRLDTLNRTTVVDRTLFAWILTCQEVYLLRCLEMPRFASNPLFSTTSVKPANVLSRPPRFLGCNRCFCQGPRFSRFSSHLQWQRINLVFLSNSAVGK